jgi:hypothetical protein
MQSRALTYVTMLSGDRLHGGVRSAGDDGGTRVLLLLTLTACTITLWLPYCALQYCITLYSRRSRRGGILRYTGLWRPRGSWAAPRYAVGTRKPFGSGVKSWITGIVPRPVEQTNQEYSRQP